MENTFKVSDTVIRKGRLCKIIHIDNSLVPPAFTVLMLDTNTEVGTEFSRIKKVPILKKKPKRKRRKRKRRGGLMGYLFR